MRKNGTRRSYAGSLAGNAAFLAAALGSWSMQHLVDYTHRTFASIADVTR